MADGVRISSPNLSKNLAKLRKVAPNLDEHIDKALSKSVTEYVAHTKAASPKDSGDLAKSIGDEKTEEGYAVKAAWYWSFVEFGTIKQTAQPFFFPVYRLLKKRIKGRIKRAMNKAVKEAMK